MEAGHGGASGRLRSQKETAMKYAFFVHLAGVDEGGMAKPEDEVPGER